MKSGRCNDSPYLTTINVSPYEKDQLSHISKRRVPLEDDLGRYFDCDLSNNFINDWVLENPLPPARRTSPPRAPPIYQTLSDCFIAPKPLLIPSLLDVWIPRSTTNPGTGSLPTPASTIAPRQSAPFEGQRSNCTTSHRSVSTLRERSVSTLRERSVSTLLSTED